MLHCLTGILLGCCFGICVFELVVVVNVLFTESFIWWWCLDWLLVWMLLMFGSFIWLVGWVLALVFGFCWFTLIYLLLVFCCLGCVVDFVLGLGLSCAVCFVWVTYVVYFTGVVLLISGLFVICFVVCLLVVWFSLCVFIIVWWFCWLVGGVCLPGVLICDSCIWLRLLC